MRHALLWFNVLISINHAFLSHVSCDLLVQFHNNVWRLTVSLTLTETTEHMLERKTRQTQN